MKVLIDRAEQVGALKSGDKVIAYNGQACWALEQAGKAFTPLDEVLTGGDLNALDHELVAECQRFCRDLEETLGHPFEEAGYQVYKAVCGAATRHHYLRQLLNEGELTLFRGGPWEPFRGRLEGVQWRHSPPACSLPPLPPKKRSAPPLNFLWRQWNRPRGYSCPGQLVFVDRQPYEWEPIIQALGGKGCWVVEKNALTLLNPYRRWTFKSERVPALPLPSPLPRLQIEGFDLRPHLSRWLTRFLGHLPSLERGCRRLLEQLERVPEPRCLCYDSMPGFRYRRLAVLARRQGWPSVAFQHGGAYGTHQIPSHRLMEIGTADFFLSYGPGISFESATTQTLPVGPSRALPRTGKAKNKTLLYLGEYSSGNDDSGLFLTEDTRRYRQQVTLLTRFKELGFEVTFRPFPGGLEEQATPWFCRQSGIAVDRNTSLQRLLSRHQLVVTDSSSGTVWNEVLWSGLPLVVLLQPGQPALKPEFESALRAAGHLCHQPEEVLEVVGRGPRPGSGVGPFLARYYNSPGQVERLSQALRRVLAG